MEGTWEESRIEVRRPLDDELRALADSARAAGRLREQTEAELLQLEAIGSRLAGGDVAGAAGLVRSSRPEVGKEYSTIVAWIENRLLASLLVGKAAQAFEGDVDFEVDPASRLRRLPPVLAEADAVSVVGNLLQNALDAVADAPSERRRVAILISEAGLRLRIRVRDWGPGLDGSADEILLSPGFSTKPGHPGVGLGIVRKLVQRAGGALSIERLPVGAAFEVTVPYA